MQSMFDICQANLEIVFLNIIIAFNYIALISPLELGVRLNNIKYLRNELITVFGWSIPKPKSKKNIVHRWNFNTFLADTSLNRTKFSCIKGFNTINFQDINHWHVHYSYWLRISIQKLVLDIIYFWQTLMKQRVPFERL